MKNNYFFLALAVVMLALSVRSHAQTITNVYISDSCTGSSSQLHIYSWIQISAAGANQSIQTFWGDGSSNTQNLGINQSTIGFFHTYNSPGTYTIQHVLFHNSSPIDTYITSYSLYCSFVNVKAYIDNNNNCIKDVSDHLSYHLSDVEVDSAGTIVDTITFYSGLYYKTKPGVVYKFKILNLPLGVSTTCPSNGVITATGPTTSVVDADFGFQCGTSPAFDLRVTMSGFFRPVATSRMSIMAYNSGCGAQNAVLTVQLNSKYIYKNASVTPTSVTGNTITWNINNMPGNTSKYIILYVDTATGANVQAGDTVCNSVTITPTSGDVNLSNNSVYQCDSVRASWDPNDKHVYPAGDITPGTKLAYTINFENLGNDTAFNIYIMDTLSGNLDAGSLQVLASSHAASHVMLDGPGGQKIVRFDFKDIHLPDKNSPGFNKGFVQFSINVKNGLAPLTPISNRAGIYFDINPPIITNYAENRIRPVSVNDITISNQVTVYPNPVTDVLTVQMNNGGYDVMRLINNMGQVVASQNMSGDATTINMTNLPTGVYYLQLTGKYNSITQKIEKH